MKNPGLKIVLVFFPAVAAVSGIFAQTPPPLQTLVLEALRNNPELNAARFKTQGSQAMVKGQKALDPPQVGVEFYQTPVGSFPNPLRDQQEIDYSLSQMIPFPGKRSSMAKAEGERSTMQSAEAAALEWKITRQVKSTYYELWNFRKQRELNTENHSHLEKIAQIARKQYEVESGRYAELLRAQAEASRLSADSIRLQQQERSALAMFNALLSRPAKSAVEIPDSLESMEITWTADQLTRVAGKNRPELQAMAANRRMAEWEATASRREFYPDFDVRLMYKDMLMSQPDYWALMVNMTLPVAPWAFSMTDSKYSQARFSALQAREGIQNMQNMVATQIQTALSAVESNQAIVRLYRDITLPKTRQALESSLTGYQAGTVEFPMLIDTWHTLTMTKTDFYMAVMNALQSQAELESACGRSLEEIPAEISKEVKP